MKAAFTEYFVTCLLAYSAKFTFEEYRKCLEVDQAFIGAGAGRKIRL